MIDNNFISAVLNHENALHLLREYSEGTNKWLPKILQSIDRTIDNNGIRKGLNSHLRDVHTLQHHYGVTKASFNEFLNTSTTGRIGISYVLRSVQSHNENIFLPAAAALKIALDRKEPDYERFTKELNTYDHTFALVMYV